MVHGQPIKAKRRSPLKVGFFKKVWHSHKVIARKVGWSVWYNKWWYWAPHVAFYISILQLPLIVSHLAATFSRKLFQLTKRLLSLMPECWKLISKLRCFGNILDWCIRYVLVSTVITGLFLTEVPIQLDSAVEYCLNSLYSRSSMEHIVHWDRHCNITLACGTWLLQQAKLFTEEWSHTVLHTLQHIFSYACSVRACVKH